MGVKITNNATATLAASIDDNDTALTVATGKGAFFPTLGGGDYFRATLKDAAGNLEIIKVTARAADGFTIERAQEGTTARAWLAGDRISANLTAAFFVDWAASTAAAAVLAASDYTDSAIASLKNGVSSAFDTLKELADAIAGKVSGPITSTNNGFPAFDGTSGATLKDSGYGPADAAAVRAATANKLPPMDVVRSAMDWVALTDGATVAVDHAAGVNRKVTLAGNRAFGAPTNGKVGWPLNIWVVQDGTGSRVPSWNAAYDFGDAGTPALSTGANQADLLTFVCLATDKFAFLGIRKRID